MLKEALTENKIIQELLSEKIELKKNYISRLEYGKC